MYTDVVARKSRTKWFGDRSSIFRKKGLKVRKFVLMLLLSMVFINCEKQPPTPPLPATAAWSGKMSFTTEPSPPITAKNTVFRLKLTDEAGKPVSGAAVRAALKMTTMDMGKNEVDLVSKGGGEYAGTGKFTMAGPWTIEVTADVDGKNGRQSFPVVVHRE